MAAAAVIAVHTIASEQKQYWHWPCMGMLDESGHVLAADFPSLALEDEAEEDDFDARRRAQLRARFASQAPVVFSRDVDDPRLCWKDKVLPPRPCTHAAFFTSTLLPKRHLVAPGGLPHPSTCAQACWAAGMTAPLLSHVSLPGDAPCMASRPWADLVVNACRLFTGSLRSHATRPWKRRPNSGCGAYVDQNSSFRAALTHL